MTVLAYRFRGTAHSLECSSDSTLADVAPSLATASGALLETLKLIAKGGARPLSGEAARALRVAELGSGPFLLLGSTAAELSAQEKQREQADAHARAERLPTAAHQAEVHARRSASAGASVPILPTSSPFFGRFQTLPFPAAVQPPPSAALALLHELAADPGIVKVMRDRRWHVGLLSEMPPEGKVGVSAVCVLGYNVNAGQEISLRLRTDDLRGLRLYARVRETLIHELAHMTYSEHDLRFRQLNSQLTREARVPDWRRAEGRRIAEAAPSRPEPAPAQPGPRTLGAAAAAPGDARAAAAAAAMAREAERAMEAEAAAALEEGGPA